MPSNMSDQLTESWGRRAREHIERWHRWSRVAALYADLVERFPLQPSRRLAPVA